MSGVPADTVWKRYGFLSQGGRCVRCRRRKGTSFRWCGEERSHQSKDDCGAVMPHVHRARPPSCYLHGFPLGPVPG